MRGTSALRSAQPTRGHISVRAPGSEPLRVIVDGLDMGATPWEGDLPAGAQNSQIGAVIAAWLATLGADKPITSGELIERSMTGHPDMGLNRALAAVASLPGRSEIDARRLGIWLGRNRDRVINNFKIRSRLDTHNKQQMWWLEAKDAGQQAAAGMRV